MGLWSFKQGNRSAEKFITYCSNLNLTYQDDTRTNLRRLCWMLKMQKQLAVLEVTLTVSENEEPDILSSQMWDHLNPR